VGLGTMGPKRDHTYLMCCSPRDRCGPQGCWITG
jgi:hypothetical protein